MSRQDRMRQHTTRLRRGERPHADRDRSVPVSALPAGGRPSRVAGQMTCPTCGAPHTPTARYCGTCGSRLGGPAPAQPSSAVPSAGTEGGTHQPLAPGTLLQGHYRIERVLGSGAFGRVYLATDTQDAAQPFRAIKELLDHEFASPADKRDAIAWFKREVSTLLSLEHAGISAIYGFLASSKNRKQSARHRDRRNDDAP